MDALILDASVAISWCFPNDPTETTAYSRYVLDLLEEVDAIVPEIWAYEIANNIFVSHALRKRISETQIREFVALLEQLPIRVDRCEWGETLRLESLARKHRLAAYDVAYLETARRLKLPLATTDQPLQRAAVAEGVAVIAPRFLAL